MHSDRLGKRAHKLFSKIKASVFWCDNCNLPLLTRTCGICRSYGRPLRITPPADVRPALGVDYVQLWQLIRRELGDSQPYPQRRIVLLNKIPYPDTADEVILDGYVIGHRYFDLKERMWRFRPLYVGVSEILRRRSGYYAIVELEHLVRNYEIHKDRFIEAYLPNERGRYVALATQTGFEGLGVVIDRGRIRVLKSWKRKSYAWNSANPTWYDAVLANESRLKLLEDEAIDYLRELAWKTGLKPVVSFSGGKDSLVTYRLAEKAFGNVPILFNDTGLELPETIEYVKVFAERKRVELLTADADQRFWSSLEVMGPPARDYRWCCKVCKLVPTAKVFKDNFSGGALSIVGQRRLESLARAMSPRTYRNKWIPNVLVAAPIHNWSQLEVWLYIFKEKLPINKLYFKGFDRLGCWLCPSLELGEVEFLKKINNSLWQKWEKFLKEYAKQNNLGREWIDYGLWRWINVPGDIKRYITNNYYYKTIRSVPIKIEIFKNEVKLNIERKFIKKLDILTLAELLNTIGEVSLKSGYLTVNDAMVKVKSSDDALVIEIESKTRLRALLSAALRATLCLGCGSCGVWCPRGAIEISGGRPRVDVSKCTRCGICNSVCPLTEYLLDLMRKTGNLDSGFLVSSG